MSDKPGFTIVDKRNISMEQVEAALADVNAWREPGADEDALERAIDAAELLMQAGLEPIATDGMVSVHELYAVGLPVRAFDNIAPNTLLLMPIRRPGKSDGGIVLGNGDEEKGTLGTNCVAYHVAGVGPVAAAADQHPQTWLPVEAGDVVIVRNAMLDTLHPDLEPLQIHRRHVLAKLRVREFTKE